MPPKKKSTWKTLCINGQGENSEGSYKSTVINLSKDLKELLDSLSKDLKEGDFNYYASKLVDAGIYNRDLLSSSSDSVLKRAGLSNIEERRKLLNAAIGSGHLLEEDLNLLLHSKGLAHYADNLSDAGITTLQKLSASTDIKLKEVGIKGIDACRLWRSARIAVNPYSTTRMGRLTSGSP